MFDPSRGSGRLSVSKLDKRKIFIIAILLSSLFACVRVPAPVTRPEDALAPGRMHAALHDDMEFRGIAASVRQSLEYYKKLPPDAAFQFGPDRVTGLDLVATLQAFLRIVEDDSLTSGQKIDRIRNDFVFYRAAGSDRKGKMLFTGYYEPMISCRTSGDKTHRYPLYRRPDDILEIDLTQFGNGFPKNKIYGRLSGRKVVPYYSREEIDRKKVLSGKGLEILWCTDPVDIFVLQVQGSGKADLGDGSVVSVLYDASNGRPYTSIGRHLIDTGAIAKENMSMQAIRQYLRDNPAKLAEVLDRNQSYVFFRLDTGPSLGNIGVPLTPGRSIATDSRLFPKGALALMVSRKPVIENGVIKDWTPFTRFVVNQDTGGAIKGAGRADVFFGQGPEAELSAGNLQEEGELYFLVRRK